MANVTERPAAQAIKGEPEGPLRVSTRRAGEVIWALASPDIGRMLCDELGWSPSDHARWLADTLTRSLLPDG